MSERYFRCQYRSTLPLHCRSTPSRLSQHVETETDKFGGKKRKKLEADKKDQGRSSVIIDSSLLKWCQEVQSAQRIILTAIRKASNRTTL